MFDDLLLKNLIMLEREINSQTNSVVLTGTSLTLGDINTVGRKNAKVIFTDDKKILQRIRSCYQNMIENVENGIPVYGCNTGYGAQASRILINGTKKERIELAKKISEGITHVDVSVGPEFEKDITRGAILIRMNMLMKGLSGIKIKDINTLRQLLNKQLTPVVNKYGGIGASGDLAHNCRILNAARGYPNVKIRTKDNNIEEAESALLKYNIPLLKLDPKAGLGFVNGDNFSSSLACFLAIDTLESLLISFLVGAMMIEVLKGTNRSFHPLLSKYRPHTGQDEVSNIFRFLLSGSQLAYQEMDGHQKRPPGIKVQDAYSLRCISQYYGVCVEKLKQVFQDIQINVNSVSDNPLWVPPQDTTKNEKPWQWISGGNFLATYMVEAMDTLRKIMTYIVKINDRHLCRLVNPHENNGLPPNLSDPVAITQCSFKGIQIQSGMLEVYSSLLSVPVSTFFGVHEENNQDITSHALTSGIIAQENLRLVRYSLAQNLLALTQAVDLRGGKIYLSQRTKHLYEFIRTKIKYIKKEQPLNNEIEHIYNLIIDGSIPEIIRSKIFFDYK